MFKEKMNTSAIPERVYALCKIVEEKPISTADIKDKMEPDFLENGSVYFNDYKNAAEELKLITLHDNMASLSVSADIISSFTSMRRYINSIIKNYSNGQFFKVTNAFFALDSSILSSKKNISEMGIEMTKITGMPVDDKALRGWRFWSSYLGFGYMHDMFFLPNPHVFLNDIINIAEFEENKKYTFSDFIEIIMPYASIIFGEEINKKQISFGVSNGLRTLQDAGIIKLEHVLDYADKWNLYPCKAHTIPGTVTNITIIKKGALI